MAKRFSGVVNVDITQSVPDWAPYTQPIAPEGTPSVLYNTIVILVSDNGASGEGGPNGSVNENKMFNGIADTIEANLPHLDELGSPLTYNHYPTGWAWAWAFKFSIAGEGLNVGKDGAEPVTDDYPGETPWPFTGGTIRRAAVDVSGEPFVDLAAEARMALLRD